MFSGGRGFSCFSYYYYFLTLGIIDTEGQKIIKNDPEGGKKLS